MSKSGKEVYFTLDDKHKTNLYEIGLNHIKHQKKEKQMTKYKYHINNLDCASCAREIEETLIQNPDLNNVIVNFNTCKLTYESTKIFSIQELNKLVKLVEPDASVSLDNMNSVREFKWQVLFLALIKSILAAILPLPAVIQQLIYLVSYLILLYRPGINAFKMLINKKGINENALITISCLGAYFIGEIFEGLMVSTLYSIGKMLEEKALNNSRQSINDLLNIKVPFANKVIANKTVEVKVEDVEVGDILLIKKGEKIPVDGIVVKGTSQLDTSALTGESKLTNVTKSDQVLSGSINMDNVLEIKATSTYDDSTVAKILSLLESATDKKAKVENVVSKISKVYTPLIIVLAVLIIVLLPLFNISWQDSLYRGFTFLVISCPCAIAISVPLSYFTAIGVASKNGILIKGSNYLDNLSNAQNIIFDKTGTLTKGEFTVSKISIARDFTNKYTEEEIINLLLKGESMSNHPIAKSILTWKSSKVDNSDISGFQEMSGKGLSFIYNGQKVIIGNTKLCHCQYDATLHLNIDNKHVASIYIDDGIKPNAKEMIKTLKQNGLITYMFTGDKKEIAINIGQILDIDHVQYEMLPTDKFTQFEEISKKGLTIFVGDGINDAPVLKRADIGIAMGKAGIDSAIEASDIVLMSDELDRILIAIAISKYTKKIIKENLIFAISMKVLILLLSIVGLANMWMAVFADTGLTLLTIFNTLRIIKKFKNNNGGLYE